MRSAERIRDDSQDLESDTNAPIVKTRIRLLRTRQASVFDRVTLVETVRGFRYTRQRQSSEPAIDVYA